VPTGCPLLLIPGNLPVNPARSLPVIPDLIGNLKTARR